MSAAKKPAAKYQLPDGTRSVQSVWIWRGFFFMSLIAVGIAIGLFQTKLTFYASMWTVIAIGWFTISMWLWRKHVRDDDEAYAASQSGRRKK
jgi:hypothetical protein